MALEIDLEQRNGARQVGSDAVVQLASHTCALTGNRILNGLVGGRRLGWRDRAFRFSHRAAALLRYDCSRAMTSGLRKKRSVR